MELDAFSFAIGALASLAIAVCGMIIFEKQDKPKEDPAKDFFKHEIDSIRRELDGVKFLTKNAKIELDSDSLQEIRKAAIYGAVVASRAEKKKLPPEQLSKYRLGWWVTANRLADIARTSPIDDMKRPQV